MEDQNSTTDNAQVTGQKPPTKVFIIEVGQIRSYNIYVEAESKEQAEEAWENTQFEYTACHQPEYEWDPDEYIIGVYDSNDPVEDAVVDYHAVRSALGLESLDGEE